ncbi:MAG: Na+/H+ antiporter [Casimicrobiaceae bacterium]
MEIIEVTLGLVLAVALIAAVAKWVPVPMPLLLVAGGVMLSYIPGLREFAIPPEVFFMLFIPPLLFSDGWLIPKRDLISALRPVLLHAFGLVFLTVLVVGYFIHWLIPEVPLAAGFALGAVISPTDAVAVSAITGNLKVPTRVTTIVNGESLINDASGLVAFKFAVAAVVTGVFSWSGAVLQFFVLSIGGFVLGLAIAWVIGQLRVHLKRFCVIDPTIQTVFSLLTPYAAYLAAERLGVGSILAVVAAGLYAGVHDARHIDAPTRNHAWEVWTMLLFAFNGLVFILLGVQLHSIIDGVSLASAGELAGYALALSATVIVLRLLWVFPAAMLPPLLSKRIREKEGTRDPRLIFLTGWAGIRGSVTMAAALSIPLVTASGAPFPGRNLIILLAASVIVVTLLLNGLTLPFVIRTFGIHGDGMAEREERAARIATAHAAIDALQKQLSHLDHNDEVTYAKSLIAHYEQRSQRYSANADRRRHLDSMDESRRRIWMAAVNAEREELMQMREADEINDEVLRLLQTGIDIEEALIVGATRRGH